MRGFELGFELDTTGSRHQVREKLDRGRYERTGKARLGPIVGRRKELLSLAQNLCRKIKNNPVLLGEAGVVKTAAVEALAIRVALAKGPRVLAGRKIIELDIGHQDSAALP